MIACSALLGRACRDIFALAVALFGILLAGLAIVAIRHGSHLHQAVALCVGVALALSTLGLESLVARWGWSRRATLGLLCALFLASRALWAVVAPIRLESDFATYHRMAARAFTPRMQAPTMNEQARPWGYPLALGLAYRVLGVSQSVGKALNLCAGLLSLLMVWRLARRYWGDGGALRAALFVLVWPSQLLYTSVLASEHLGLALAVALMLCTTGQAPVTARPWRFLWMGALGAAAYAVRTPLALFALIGLVAAGRQRPFLPRGLLSCAALVAGYGMGWLGYDLLCRRAFGAPAPHPGALNLLIGTNTASGGWWNAEDSKSFLAHPTIEAANHFAFTEAWARVTRDPAGIAALAVRKAASSWSLEGFAAYWALSGAGSVNRLYALCQGFHAALLVLAAIGTFAALRRGRAASLFPLLIVLAAAICINMTTEAQDRYHYVFSPLLICLASWSHGPKGPAATTRHPPHHHRTPGIKQFVDVLYWRLGGQSVARGAAPPCRCGNDREGG